MLFDTVIRFGQPEDVRRLAVLAAQVWLHTYATEGIAEDIAEYVRSEFKPEKYTALLGNPAACVFVAERGPALVGFSVLRGDAPCPIDGGPATELQTLYVQENFKRQGVGKALLRAAEGAARMQTGAAMWLAVNAQNRNAVSFYARHGYARIGTTFFELGDAQHENHVLSVSL